jgi:hypothetical protein
MLSYGERTGEALIRQGLTAAVTIGTRSAEAYANAALGGTGKLLGAFGAGLRECLTGLAIAREIGHLEWTVFGLAVLGRLRRECGDGRASTISASAPIRSTVRTTGGRARSCGSDRARGSFSTGHPERRTRESDTEVTMDQAKRGIKPWQIPESTWLVRSGFMDVR